MCSLALSSTQISQRREVPWFLSFLRAQAQADRGISHRRAAASEWQGPRSVTEPRLARSIRTA